MAPYKLVFDDVYIIPRITGDKELTKLIAFTGENSNVGWVEMRKRKM